MSTLAAAELVERIWARDATVWTGADEAKWLGWLDEPMRTRSRRDELLRFVEDIAAHHRTTRKPGAVRRICATRVPSGRNYFQAPTSGRGTCGIR